MAISMQDVKRRMRSVTSMEHIIKRTISFYNTVHRGDLQQYDFDPRKVSGRDPRDQEHLLHRADEQQGSVRWIQFQCDQRSGTADE